MASINPSAAAQTSATKNLPILKRGSKGRTVAYSNPKSFVKNQSC
jgi:hypothetical protein